MFDSLRRFDPKHVYSSDAGTPGVRPNTMPEESMSIDAKTDGKAKPDAGAKKK